MPEPPDLDPKDQSENKIVERNLLLLLATSRTLLFFLSDMMWESGSRDA